MERQTILERLGWRFIRIRGSEYFRNPEETIERVVKELSAYGIEPEDSEVLNENKGTNYELLERVKACAARIIAGAEKEIQVDIDTISAALDSKSIVESNTVSEKTEPISCESESVQAKSDSCTEVSTLQSEKNTSSLSNRTNKSMKADAKKSTKQLRTPMPEQLVMPGIELSANTDTDVIALLKKNNVMYIDKRSNNGALWIIGGKELTDIVKQCRKLGVKFTFKEDGGRVTKGKAGWWAK